MELVGSSRGRDGGAGRDDGGAQVHGRVPPSDVEAERAVLSAILLDNDVLPKISDRLSAEDFYHPAHQTLFQAMRDLEAGGEPVDLVMLANHLQRNDQLEAVGGAVMLAEISDHEATPANAEHYAGIVREKSVKRGLIAVATEIVALGFDPSEIGEQLLDTAESKICGLASERARNTLTALKDEMNAAVDHIETLMTRGDALTGLDTGYRELNKLTGGLQPGDLMILAARPSMGKTALALNIARNAAFDHGSHVAVFSIEMTTRSLVLRMLSSEAEVDFSTFHRGLISTDAHSRIVQAAGRLAEAPIWIDDNDSATVLEIRAKARRLHKKHRLDLVVVDYLQLVKGDARNDNREQEISEISRGLKGLAKELNIPVLALSQLNRGPEMRKTESKRPMLADLRESGAIEQDADVIAFIYRDFVYNKETEYEDLAELIVAKQRNGPTDTVRLRFEGRFARFADWSQEDYSPHHPQSGSFAGPSGDDPFDSEPPFEL